MLTRSLRTFTPKCLRSAFTTTTQQPSRHYIGESLYSASNKSYDNPVGNSEAEMGYHSTDNLFYDNRLDNTTLADPTNRTFQYLVSGSQAFIFASLGRAYVNRFVASWSASADTMALASVEVDISELAEGTAATFKWRGKPVFVRYRTEKEIEAAKVDDNNKSLRDPAVDAERFTDPRYAVLIGICTHLGCVPMNGAGDFGGWFCPCHGSHYDLSGRIRKGPAPLNLEIPPYKFLTETKLLLG
jgi:ubiquinol-cytochrome c reductase iron-sulfur subunit